MSPSDAATRGPALTGQVLRYLATGVANTVFGLAIILALHMWAGVSLVASNLAGYAAGFALSFLLNRSWTFAHRGDPLRSAALYASLVALAFGLNLAVVVGLQHAGLAYPVAQAAGAVFYSAIVFLGLRNVVFASRP